MDIKMRGNPGIMKKIRDGAKQCSELNGLADGNYKQSSMPVVESGAAASMKKREKEKGIINGVDSTINSKGSVSSFEGTYEERIEESLSMLCHTKEYFNAVHGLFDMHMMGRLDEALELINPRDRKELRGILKEFSDNI